MLLRAGVSGRFACRAVWKRSVLQSQSRRTVSAANKRSDYCFVATQEAATKQLASLLALDLRAGDCYCLVGEVGCGKSAFSRAFIRSAFEDDELPVPSPTYLLQQMYEGVSGPPIHHFDVYRLEGDSSIDRLDLPSSFREAVTLIEWADKLQQLPEHRLNIDIRLVSEQTQASLLSDGIEQSPQDPSEAVEDSAYEDKHWRMLCLHPMGHLWHIRMEEIRHHVKLHGSGAACAMSKLEGMFINNISTPDP